MTEDDFRSNPPRPGDKVWLKPAEVVDVYGINVIVRTEGVGNVRVSFPDIDRIERAPRVPVVGDRVMDRYNDGYQTVLAIDGDHAWLKTHKDLYYSSRLSDLRVIEP